MRPCNGSALRLFHSPVSGYRRLSTNKTVISHLRRLEAETQRILKQSDVIKAIHAKQAAPADMGGEALGKFIAVELARSDAVRRAANIQQID